MEPALGVQKLNPDTIAPLLSILIPAYNHEKYICDCLDSMLNIDVHGGVEIVLIDDGSRDATLERASAWIQLHQDRFVRVHCETQVNQGLPKTLNRLNSLAKGVFVSIVASDDQLLPNAFNARFSAFRNSSVLAVYGDSLLMDEDGNPFGASLVRELGVHANVSALLDSKRLPMEIILRWSGCGPGLMYRREMLDMDHLGPWREDLLFEDREMFLRMVSRGVLRFIDTPVARYRVGRNSFCRDVKRTEKVLKCIYLSESMHVGSFTGIQRLALWLRSYQSWLQLNRRQIVFLPLRYSIRLLLGVLRCTHDIHVMMVGRMNR